MLPEKKIPKVDEAETTHPILTDAVGAFVRGLDAHTPDITT